MPWSLSPRIAYILDKGADAAGITAEEAMELMALDLGGREVYALMAVADSLSRAAFGPKGERHFHIGLNVQPCPYDCRFCSLAKCHGIFTQSQEFSREEVMTWAQAGEEQGADALNLMTTGNYPFSRLLDLGRFLSARVKVPLVANTRDISHAEGEALVEAGFKGFYHAIRMGEGRDTPFDPERRLATVRVLKDVGLNWMNCIEPVGPEHSFEEMARLMVLARENRATYSGVMRRINFPGSPFEKEGMISEREMARLVAVSRLVMGDVPQAHCTHEPHAASLMAGANLFFPEVGSSPRDRQADTGEGRGQDLERCAQLMLEMGLDPGPPSNCFGPTAPSNPGYPRTLGG